MTKIDKGTLIIENEQDKKIVERYLKALAEGDETYQPAGLKKVQRSKVFKESSVLDQEFFRTDLSQINFINTPQ